MDNTENAKKQITKEVIEMALTHGVEVVFREGEALPLHHPESTKITGAIDAPSRFVESRKGLFEPKKSFTKINRDEKTIKMHIDEQAAHGWYYIEGRLLLSKEFTELGINTNKSYNPVELANVLKLRRSIFENVTDHAGIIYTLRNIKAKINKQIEEGDDTRGNVSKHFEQTVESNMPESFNIKLPLIKGEPKIQFPVNVVLKANGSDIICYLESIEAAEFIDEICEKRIDEEIDKIKDFTTIIEE